MTYARSWFLLMLASSHAKSLNRTLSTSFRILVVILIGFFQWTTLACSCFGSSLERTYGVSDAVIEAQMIPGSMTGTERSVYSEFNDREYTYLENRSVLLSISKVWKGEEVETVRIYDPSHTNCGFTFRENQTYIVFADFRYAEDSSTNEQTSTSNSKISPVSTTYFPSSPAEDQDVTQEEKTVSEKTHGKPLFTHYCMENVRVPEDRSSDLIKSKLDRLQEEAARTPIKNEFNELLQNRIREIVESSDQVSPSPY